MPGPVIVPIDPRDPRPIGNRVRVGITIRSPGQGAKLTIKASNPVVRISGTALIFKLDGGQGDVSLISKVEVRIGNGRFKPARKGSDNTWSSWTFDSIFEGAAGTHELKITAKVTARQTNPVEKTHTVSVTLNDDKPPEPFTIEAPKEVIHPPYLFSISGIATDSHSGIKSVEWAIDENSGYKKVQRLFRREGTFHWSTDIFLNVLGTHKIRVRQTDNAGNQRTVPKEIRAVDETPPNLSITSHRDNERILGTEDGAEIELQGKATDTQTGVKKVEWDLDNSGNWKEAVPKASNDWSTWHTSISMPIPGDYVITVRAIDNADNPPEVQKLTLTITRPFEQEDPLAAVSSTAYLKDLLEFSGDRLTVDDQRINSGKLTANFYQPFVALTKSGNKHEAYASVSQVRLCTEVLHKFISDRELEIPGVIELNYRQQAYFTLLQYLGVSFEELRMTQSIDVPEREKLAERLGIERDVLADALEQLTLVPDEITEEGLEQLFGLARTTEPKDFNTEQIDWTLRDIEPSLLFLWRKDHLSKLWLAQDDAARSSFDAPVPIIEPDIVFIDDIATPGNRVSEILNARQQWITDKMDALRAKHPPTGTAQAGFEAIVNDIVGPLSDLLTLYQRHQHGQDIKPDLSNKQLDIQAFLFLMGFHDLAVNVGKSILEREWQAVDNILVQVLKLREYSAWRAEESDQGLYLGPLGQPTGENFKLAPVSGELPTWRATQSQRREWEETLKSRINQLNAMNTSLREAVIETEARVLPQLRNALVELIAKTSELEIDNAANQLTQELAIDCHGGGRQKTSRVKQAIETLQSVLFSVRTEQFALESVLGGELLVAKWAWVSNIEEADFDEEWRWMGTYATWRSATFVFGYPENYLLPSLRTNQSEAFGTFLRKLRSQSRLTPLQARQDAKTFLTDLTITPPLSEEEEKEELLTEQLSETQLQNRQVDVKARFNDITDPHAAPTYIQEIFYFAPMALGLQLQKAGHFLAALDWFQTVYAYNLPLEKRKIYYGLVLEGKIQTKFDRNINWLAKEILDPHKIAKDRANAYVRFTLMSLVRCFLDFADSEFTRDTQESLPRARGLYIRALEILDLKDMEAPVNANGTPSPFPANPVLGALRLRAGLNLLKLRRGLNIAGLQRQSEPEPEGFENLPAFGDFRQIVIPRSQRQRPTLYRYAVLIERAKQLVAIAQQMESAFLSAVERRDNEEYTLIKARQDIGLAEASVQLQDLRVSEAQGGVKLAELQRQRAGLQKGHFNGLLDEGFIWQEQAAIGMMTTAAALHGTAAFISGTGILFDTALKIATFGVGGDPATKAAQVATSLAAAASTSASILQTFASHERRKQDWTLQRNLAHNDLLVGDQQITIAQGHVQISEQERIISEIQADYAADTLDFLANKFSNAELYDWMSNILSQIYSYFLQQATAMAQLAQNQLAFERQETAPALIQANYWQTLSETESNNVDETVGRRGITGSARLLQDLTKLDLYAFETSKRKLQISQTFSLAQMAPAEFQRFRETGLFRFGTPMELFDQAFPGHYLRLIKQVKISVIALIPPIQGIRATLVSSGLSRVVIGSDIFEKIVARRDPELIAFTSPANATGRLDLQPDNELLLPFEGMGVDSSWELQLPKAANLFDYSTLADVFFTIDYTALNSFIYRQDVTKALNRGISADRPYSFRQQFADQWYDLNNPDQMEEPMTIEFRTTREDFPSNFENLRIQQIVLFFSRTDGSSFEIPVSQFQFNEDKTNESIDVGAAHSREGVISTRRGNAGNWHRLIGREPFGTWELGFSDEDEIINRFKQGEVEDIFLIITYSADLPKWPD